MDPPDAGKGLLPHRSFHLVPFSRLPLLPSVQIHKYTNTQIQTGLVWDCYLFQFVPTFDIVWRFKVSDVFVRSLAGFLKERNSGDIQSRGGSDCICLLTFLNQRRTSGASERGIFSSEPCFHGVAMSVRLTGSATPF